MSLELRENEPEAQPAEPGPVVQGPAWVKRGMVFAIIVAALVAAYAFDLHQLFTLERLKDSREQLEGWRLQNPLLASLGFFGVYVVSTALSIPGAVILTLGGGFLFGFWWALLIVSFASTIGATLAFLVSRFLLRDFVEKKFSNRLSTIQNGLDRDGPFYLFTLRLIPVFPFFLINLVMGLTRMPVLTFFWVSQVGMLLGTAVYVNAGTQLGTLETLGDIMSPSIWISFAAIGLLPLVSRVIVKQFRKGSGSGEPATGALAESTSGSSSDSGYDYNLVVIGAGAAGLVTSYIGAAVNAKVALIEKNTMGGDCLNSGCVPSKALIRAAHFAAEMRRAEEFGFAPVTSQVDFGKVMDRIHASIAAIAPNDSVARYTSLGVDCVQGDARILSRHKVQVGDRILTTKNVVIASGAEPLVPPIPGLADIPYLTSDTVWNLRELPQRLVVLGGGPIGCELAQAFARLGSKVTIVEMGDRLLAREDADASAYVEKSFRKDGIDILTGHKAAEFKAGSLLCVNDQGDVGVEFDQVLVALGRKARIQGFGLEELGVCMNKGGQVEADAFLQTNVEGIYVCGDATGPYQFTHTAAHQAWYASVNALFGPLYRAKVDYRVIPWATYTQPEVARVGLNERDAKEQGIPHEVSRFDLEESDRAIVDGSDHGYVKVLTPPGKDTILGVTIVGPHAGEMIAEYVLAMKHGIGLNKILGTIHIYPTLAEANKSVAGVWKRANAPKRLLEWVRHFHRFRRRK
jgi:pyruvate/2-oxoglutarate dehydrogenase complex dihydrolipoamide dehydrogenase (E3) component/uncharacterized membrane protein YdjX (TVP38/TMEM64 family)